MAARPSVRRQRAPWQNAKTRGSGDSPSLGTASASRSESCTRVLQRAREFLLKNPEHKWATVPRQRC